MADKPINWGQVGHLLPIASLSESYKGPVILAHVSDDETIRWFSPGGANKDEIEHKEHVRGPQLAPDGSEVMGFLQDEEGEPVTKTRKLAATHWAIAEIVQ